MKSIYKNVNEKGITLISLIVVILITVVIASIVMKCIFDAQSIGATDIKENTEYLIGKYVDYVPENGVYLNIKKEYVGTETNSINFETDTTLNWKIWSIEGNKLTIIADKPGTIGGYKNNGGLYLANYNGYNNGVKILNDICNTCYSNKQYGGIARSLNIEDIEKVLDTSVWSPEKYVRKNAISYLMQKEYEKTTCYPYIYSVESKAIIDDVEVEEGIGRSEQNTLCNANAKYKKANKTIKPTQTAWSNSNIKEKNFIRNEYYDLIFKNGDEELTSYFLASRAVDLEESHINYGMFEVSMGKSINTNPLFNSRGASLEYWDRIRPVVEIQMDGITLDKTTDGETPETALKLIK